MVRRDAFPDIDDVSPISESDDVIFSEIRDVLARHNALERFGVTLLHDHFEIGEDEILLESCDPDTRTLVSRPVKMADLSQATMIETNWSLNSVAAIQAGQKPQKEPIKTCRSACQQIAGKGHSRVHYPI
jgi:hypothetical protein